MTRVETAKILATIAAVYQSFEVSDFKQNIWSELLKEVEYRYAVNGLTGLLKCLKYPPAVAEIIESAKIEKLLYFEKQEELKLECDRNKRLPAGDPGMLSTDYREGYDDSDLAGNSGKS
ncbi:replicative helicase loader/inhibitor [Eubacteriaceae bacterium ES2]|nr:replicative helicase loader/inhibitor [Eubacteriaceae bacterium ES2]